eukprot:980512-Amphidinium_carterae.1
MQGSAFEWYNHKSLPQLVWCSTVHKCPFNCKDCGMQRKLCSDRFTPAPKPGQQKLIPTFSFRIPT